MLKLLAQGLSTKEILKDYPHATKDDIAAALFYAAKITSEEVYPVTVTSERNRKSIWSMYALGEAKTTRV